MSRRVLAWSRISRPDILGLLRRQADVTADGLAAFALWSAGGAVEEARAVRAAEHDADAIHAELLVALTAALTTPIDQEDVYALSERMDQVLDSAKDTVRIAEALAWRPDGFGAAMAARAANAALHMREAIAGLGRRGARPGADADQVIKTARRIEHDIVAALASLPRDGDAFERAVTLEVYRRYSEVGRALARVGDRTWYAVMKIL